jgi:hypothetical protein
MLKAPQPEIVQLRFEIGLAMLPPCGTLHSLVLAERAVEEELRRLRGPGPEQVEHHRVCGGELGVDGELSRDGGIVDVAQVDVTLLEDHAVPDCVDAAPPGATHELGQLTAGERREAHAVEFREARDHTGACRHVEPE